MSVQGLGLDNLDPSLPPEGELSGVIEAVGAGEGRQRRSICGISLSSKSRGTAARFVAMIEE